MHLANPRNGERPPALEPRLAMPPLALLRLVALLDPVATLATEGDFEPPHPAASSEDAATARAELRISERRQRMMCGLSRRQHRS
jgi:hypothetical protein